MVPVLVQNTLLGSRMCADADDISIYYGKEVNIYDGQTIKIVVSKI